jgi:hypothetical protein
VGCLSSTQIHSKARAIRRFFITPYGIGSLQEETTMQSIMTGEPDTSHPEDVNYGFHF